MTLIADVFPTLRTSNNEVRSMSKKSRLRGPFQKGMVNGPKRSWNLNDSNFGIIFDHCEGKWVAKSLCYSVGDMENLKIAC